MVTNAVANEEPFRSWNEILWKLAYIIAFLNHYGLDNECTSEGMRFMEKLLV